MALTNSSRRVFVPAVRAAALPQAQYDFVARGFALACFAVLLAANVSLFSPRIGGFPVRGILSAGVLVLAVILFTDAAREAVRKNLLLLALAAGLACLGIFVSIANDAPLEGIVRSVREVHLQAAVVIVVTAILAQVCGARACAYAIVAVIGTSAAVAVLQMFDVQSAWDLRLALGPLQNAEENALEPVFERRPTGLSYSPIQLATQLCLGFAAYAAVRDKLRRRPGERQPADPAMIVALLVFFVACVATATRSPILGGLVFLGLYLAWRRGSTLPLLLMLGGLAVYLAGPAILAAIQSSAPRVVTIDDNSAAARSVFVYYGVRLFLDNPLGYGLIFQPMGMWTGYWPDLYTMRGAKGTQTSQLHNYVLSMINIYGVGLLLFVPLVAKLLRRAGASLIFFVPYIVHIIFHNSGPLYSDIIIWFVVAAISAAAAPVETSRPGLQRTASRVRWRVRAREPAPAGAGAPVRRLGSR